MKYSASVLIVKRNEMKNRTIVTCVLFLLLTAGVFANIKQTLKIKFESKYEVAGQKFSLKQLGLAPSAQWDKYQYLVLEMKASSSQRFQIGFNTDWGYNELRIMPYAVGEWSRVCIPLHLYREKPKPSHDLASLNNIPSVMAWYNLGSYPRGKLSNVDSIGIRMQAPINNPTLEITAIYFSDKKIEDKYLGKQYLIDEFGQWNLGDYEGKIHSLKELKETWRKEEETVNSGKSQENYSKFGGFLNARVDNGTGFFRTLKQDGRWWFVDPEGYLFLSLGVDCISPEGGTVAKMLDKRVGVYKEIPPKNIPNAPNTMAFGVWNMYRRYGDNWLESWKKMTLKRMDNWGINTIANWSSPSIIETNQKAFMLGLEVGHLGGEIMGLSNIYSPDFKQKIEQAVKEQTSNYKQNPWLIGWFTGNEPAWLLHNVIPVEY